MNEIGQYKHGIGSSTIHDQHMAAREYSDQRAASLEVPVEPAALLGKILEDVRCLSMQNANALRRFNNQFFGFSPPADSATQNVKEMPSDNVMSVLVREAGTALIALREQAELIECMMRKGGLCESLPQAERAVR